ncbi:hypothetical protein ACIRBX_22970 [Kitasatospora sp. NPDC096147]|uniref:hypothetical protein n=1 Tax=Kitasatospora sp. NPDC096147 TaxID=3364093 RepID=UPI00380C9428
MTTSHQDRHTDSVDTPHRADRTRTPGRWARTDDHLTSVTPRREHPAPSAPPQHPAPSAPPQHPAPSAPPQHRAPEAAAPEEVAAAYDAATAEDRRRSAQAGDESPAAVAAAHEAATAEDRQRSARNHGGTRPTGSATVLPPELAARLTDRLEQAVGGFVDDPRGSVDQADAALDEAIRRLTEELRERRAALRGTHHGTSGDVTDGSKDTGTATGTAERGTEDLRLALRDYRDLLHHLLTV